MNHIIDILQKLAPIAHWTIVPGRAARGEMLALPPFIAWTYVQPSEDLAQCLRHAVDTFHGNIVWELSTEGRRWLLRPARLREYAELQGCLGGLFAAAELARAEPDFGKRANDELQVLGEHILRCITCKKQESSPPDAP